MTPPAPLALVTRPEPAASAYARRLEAKGWRVLVSPVLTCEPTLPGSLPAAQGVILTSANGARHAPPDPALRDLPCWCVGEATAEAARAAGFRATRAGPSDAEALGALIAAQAPPRATLLHFKGAETNPALCAHLLHSGLVLHEAQVYLMRSSDRLGREAEAALASGEVRAAPVFSPRSARALADLVAGRFDVSDVPAPAISEAAAGPLREAGFGRVTVASAPTRAAMEAEMRALLRALRET